jgi:hypothetical protein
MPISSGLPTAVEYQHQPIAVITSVNSPNKETLKIPNYTPTTIRRPTYTEASIKIPSNIETLVKAPHYTETTIRLHSNIGASTKTQKESNDVRKKPINLVQN